MKITVYAWTYKSTQTFISLVWWIYIWKRFDSHIYDIYLILPLQNDLKVHTSLSYIINIIRQYVYLINLPSCNLSLLLSLISVLDPCVRSVQWTIWPDTDDCKNCFVFQNICYYYTFKNISWLLYQELLRMHHHNHF